MPPKTKTIYYKSFQIDIAPKNVADGKWQPLWWIWFTDEAKKFSNDKYFKSEDEANKYAEENAKTYLDKIT